MGPQSEAAILKSRSSPLPPEPTQGLANRTRAGFQPPVTHPSQPRACDQATDCTTVNRGLDPEFTFPCKGFCGFARVLCIGEQ